MLLVFCLTLLAGLPAPTRAVAFATLDGQQHPATGFFHEPHAAELDASVPRIHEMSGTYLGYQVAAVMLQAGRAPRHRFAFYDPPWILAFLRRNEAMVEVTPVAASAS